MCGKPLPEPTAEVSTPVEENAEQAPRREPEPSSPAPAYTGGIFNLGAPSDRPYHNLDYLLDDDEPKSHKGLIFLGIIALALIAGLGWLRFRNIGLPDLISDLRARASAKQPAQAPPPNPADSSPPPANADQQNTPATSTPPSPAAPMAGASTTPPSSGATPSPATPASPASNTPGSSLSPVPSSADSNPAAVTPASPSPTGSDSSVPAADAESENPAATPSAKPADAPVPKPKPTPKPAPKPAPKPPDQVTLGEQYLYGRGGMPQNCERGLRYVKPAADQSNPKAMITMGALYATGHCLSRDLPTAYRYFALALRVDPENGPLRQNAEMVWKQMTAEERKQAIRLTQ